MFLIEPKVHTMSLYRLKMDGFEYKLLELPILHKLSNNFHLLTPVPLLSYTELLKKSPEYQEAIKMNPIVSHSIFHNESFEEKHGEYLVKKEGSYTYIYRYIQRIGDFIIGFKSTIPVNFELLFECDTKRFNLGHTVNTVYELKKWIPLQSLIYSQFYLVFKVKNEDVEKVMKSTYNVNYLHLQRNIRKFYIDINYDTQRIFQYLEEDNDSPNS
jgi:hypothetical protein